MHDGWRRGDLAQHLNPTRDSVDADRLLRSTSKTSTPYTCVAQRYKHDDVRHVDELNERPAVARGRASAHRVLRLMLFVKRGDKMTTELHHRVSDDLFDSSSTGTQFTARLCACASARAAPSWKTDPDDQD